MIYILPGFPYTRVGGHVANAQMLAEGYIKYTGTVPEGTGLTLQLINGKLVNKVYDTPLPETPHPIKETEEE